MDRKQITLFRENKSWFGKFVDVWRNPRLGYVFINKKSYNVNIYLGFKKLSGKVLIWSSLKKARWVTKKWFKNGHSMLLWKDKTRVKIDFLIMGSNGIAIPREEFDTFKGGAWDSLIEYLETDDVKTRLGDLTSEVKDSLDQYIVGMPLEFLLPWLAIFIFIFVAISLLNFLDDLTFLLNLG